MPCWLIGLQETLFKANQKSFKGLDMVGESWHLGEEDQKSILKARRSRVQVYLLIGIESKVNLSYVTPYLKKKRKMKKSFVSICIYLCRIGEDRIYAPVLLLPWKSTSNISNSECSRRLGKCENRDNDRQEVEEGLSNFHFWLLKHIQNTPFNFFKSK